MVHGGSGPETDSVRAEVSGDVNRAAQEIQTSLPISFGRTEQCWLVLAAWVEQEASPGFNDATHMMLVEPATNLCGATGQIRLKWIEDVMVQGQGDAAITELGKDG